MTDEEFLRFKTAYGAILETGARISDMGTHSDGKTWFTTLHKETHMVIQQGESLAVAMERALKDLNRRVTREVAPEGFDGPTISRATYDAAEKAMRGLTWEFDEWAYRSKTR